jgi:hypothetical protein
MHYSILNDSEIAPSRWGVAMGLFIIGYISFGVSGAFYTATFPRLARNTPRSRELREKYYQGEITADACEQAEALEKSKISSFSQASTFLSLFSDDNKFFRLLVPLAS